MSGSSDAARATSVDATRATNLPGQLLMEPQDFFLLRIAKSHATSTTTPVDVQQNASTYCVAK